MYPVVNFSTINFQLKHALSKIWASFFRFRNTSFKQKCIDLKIQKQYIFNGEMH